MRSRIYLDDTFSMYKDIAMIQLDSGTFDDSLLRTIAKMHDKFVFHYIILF